MASGIYNRCKYGLMRAVYDLANENIYCALLDSDYTFNADHAVFAQVSGEEIVGIGYTANGKLLTAKTVTQDNTNDRAAWDAADVTWSSSTITARYAVLYDTDSSSNDLICCFDFGQNYTSTNGNFTISWNASGIILLT